MYKEARDKGVKDEILTEIKNNNAEFKVCVDIAQGGGFLLSVEIDRKFIWCHKT